MKRLVAVISSLLVLPAFAEVVPQYYADETMQYVDYVDEENTDDVVAEEVETVAEDESAAPAKPQPRLAGARASGTGRASASRAITSTRQATARNRATSNTASRALTARTAVATPTRIASSRAMPARTSTGATVQTTRRTAQPSGTTAARASIVQTDTVNAPLYTGRVAVRGSNAVAARIPSVRVTNTSTSTSVSATDTTDELNDLAEMTDFCKAQYTACMDNFCNVLDDNQGRCSCSVNLKNYAKTEAALKQATEDLQDVAQKIQYIGLSAAEVETLFTQTAAELTMQSTSDSSQIKNDLDKIKDMIVDVKAGTATTTDTGISLDLSGLLDFSIDSTGFDLSSFLGGNSQTESITNQRGEQLYKTAAARCKASVLNSCKTQGVDPNIITNAYDLEIDKQCLLYERSLTDANDQMSSTVRNAKSVLQKARLLVAQQKNSYDLRGCVNALDACMQDDFVCGSDYENCLDPSGKYIVNGEVVIGSTPGVSGDVSGGALYDTWNYSGTNSATNAWDTNGTVSDYISQTVTQTAVEDTSSDMSKFLQYKIGYHNDNEDKNYGMCMSVLNKCQNVTYDNRGKDSKYNPANNVVKEYLQRTLVQIKAKQDEILAEYAEECAGDVIQCLAQNNYVTDNGVDDATNKLAITACKSVVTTCMSVNNVNGNVDNAKPSMSDWVDALMGKEASK